MCLNVHTQRRSQVDDCHQDQIAQQQAALPPVILMPTFNVKRAICSGEVVFALGRLHIHNR